MNCKHVQELLPLYIGRDLEEKRTKLVTAHLQSCTECAGAADEYRETRQLLQEFAVPPFSEAVYAGIRQRVLREIGREATSPGLSQLFESLLRPRLSWAVATALLVAVSVFAFYFIANRKSHPQQVVGSDRTVDKTTSDEQPNPRSRGDDSAGSSSPLSKESGASTGQNRGADTTIGGSVDGSHQYRRPKSSGAAADRTQSIAVNVPDSRSKTAEASPESNNLARPDAVPARDPATSEKTLRVEMQTKDPNIRIIWFSQQRPKQGSPSSKGI